MTSRIDESTVGDVFTDEELPQRGGDHLERGRRLIRVRDEPPEAASLEDGQPMPRRGGVVGSPILAGFVRLVPEDGSAIVKTVGSEP